MKDVLLYSGKFLFEKCLSYDFLMLPKTKNEAAFLKLRTQIFENHFFLLTSVLTFQSALFHFFSNNIWWYLLANIFLIKHSNMTSLAGNGIVDSFDASCSKMRSEFWAKSHKIFIWCSCPALKFCGSNGKPYVPCSLCNGS